MFNKKLHEKLVDLYSIPSVDKVEFADKTNLSKPMKCWYCHHSPCVCDK